MWDVLQIMAIYCILLIYNYIKGRARMSVIELTKENFDETIQGNEIVVLDFWAPWCGPCKQFAPIYEEISEKFSETVVFAKINTEDEQDLAGHFQIRSIPTIMLFRQQIAIFSQPGAMSGEELLEIVDTAQNLDMDLVRQEIEERE